MAKTGYNDKMSSSDTDLPGLLSVIINLDEFQNDVTENLTLNTNIFEQVYTYLRILEH